MDPPLLPASGDQSRQVAAVPVVRGSDRPLIIWMVLVTLIALTALAIGSVALANVLTRFVQTDHLVVNESLTVGGPDGAAIKLIQGGGATASARDSAVTEADIAFSTPFSEPPRVLVTPHVEGTAVSDVTAEVRAVSTTGFTVALRAGSGSGTVRVEWTALQM